MLAMSSTPPADQPPSPGNRVTMTPANSSTVDWKTIPLATPMTKSTRYWSRARQFSRVARATSRACVLSRRRWSRCGSIDSLASLGDDAAVGQRPQRPRRCREGKAPEQLDGEWESCLGQRNSPDEQGDWCADGGREWQHARDTCEPGGE